MDKQNVYVVGISIVLGFLILGLSIFLTFKDFSKIDSVSKNRYEMLSNCSNIIMLDTYTGRYWVKYMNPDQAPNKWTEEATDFLKD